MSQTETETLSAKCDFVKDSWANSLYQWVTQSTDGTVKVATGVYQCRYNENVGYAPACPAFACDNDSSYF